MQIASNYRFIVYQYMNGLRWALLPQAKASRLEARARSALTRSRDL